MLIRALSFLFVLLFSIARPVPAAEAPAGVPGPAAGKTLSQNPQSSIRDPKLPPTGLSFEEAMRLGETMYRKAVLPSGKDMEATVQEDLKLSGDMVTCSKCHMRSGLGSYEGLVLSTPTNGSKLYVPLIYASELPGIAGAGEMEFSYKRPAYTDQTLANAIRYGADPMGRPLLETMPHYILDDRDMDILIFYLKNLSSSYSPGVTENEIRFATIVTEGVSPQDRNAMLDPLRSFITDEWNARLPTLRQWRQDSPHRKLSLDVWELKGPSDTWYGQLEALYRKQPVFALLGGISAGPWDPIHRFCEKNRLPCVLPLTGQPVVSDEDWYTLYYSKGYYQEGEAAAKFLAKVLELPSDKQVVQIFREDDRGKAFSRGFADTWKKIGNSKVTTRTLSAGEPVGKDFWKDLAAAYKDASLVVWLGPADLAGIDALGGAEKQPAAIVVSATMLAGSLPSIPDAVRDFTFITYPSRLPGEDAYAAAAVDGWLQFKKLPKTNMAISSNMFFFTRLLSVTLLSMRGDFYRDYFLDLLDVQGEQTMLIAAYPRVTFGPGQRYASKGCYIVTLTKGPTPKLFSQTDWVIH
jgi:hypothetical protein